MRVLAVLTLALVLSACGTRPAKVVTQRVEVPVPVTCVDQADIPPERRLETEALRKTDSVFEKVRAVTIDMKGLQADDAVMRALLEGCTTQPK